MTHREGPLELCCCTCAEGLAADAPSRGCPEGLPELVEASWGELDATVEAAGRELAEAAWELAEAACAGVDTPREDLACPGLHQAHSCQARLTGSGRLKNSREYLPGLGRSLQLWRWWEQVMALSLHAGVPARAGQLWPGAWPQLHDRAR